MELEQKGGEGRTIADNLSLFEKKKHLQQLSEDEFRDRVVSPIFERRGMKCLRDTCGSTEEGKDRIFKFNDPLGKLMVYVVQTKKGNLNMSKNASENVVQAVTQLRMALDTQVIIDDKKVFPDKAFLCASGKINDSARRYIFDCTKDRRISFMDQDDFINALDESYPEFWYGIDADTFPYLNKLRLDILAMSDTIPVIASSGEISETSPVSDENYVQLFVSHITSEKKKIGGQVKAEQKFKELPIEELLKAKERPILLIGEGGAGKTTALRRLAYVLASVAMRSAKIDMIPVLLKAADIAADDREIVSAASEETCRISSMGKCGYKDSDLHDGNVALLIDALDETRDENERLTVLRKIGQFNKFHPKCLIIMTTRDYSFIYSQKEFEGYARFFLEPLDLQQARKIAIRIVHKRELPTDVVEEVIRRLHDVHGVDLNPLLVTVFVCSSDLARKDIPANITEILKKFTEMMLDRWDEKKGFAQQFHAPLKDFILKQIAFKMHAKNRFSLPIEEFRVMIRTILEQCGHEPNFKILFDELVNRSGLLIVEDDEVRFRHHLIQEFFAGRGISEFEELRGLVHQEWWRTPILFYFGENADKAAQLKRLSTLIPIEPTKETHAAALTIGLALQACYLSDVTVRMTVLDWVVRMVAKCQNECLKELSKDGRTLVARISYYLYTRDGVATDLMTKYSDDISEKKCETEEDELVRFWTIVGLIESGDLQRAEKLMKASRLMDGRLLMIIHLSAFFVLNLRISSPGQKTVAKRIVNELSPKVHEFIEEVMKEFNSILLEIRKGEIKALQPGNEKA